VQRFKEKAKKLEEIKAWQEGQQQQKLENLETKLQKAAELRQQQITKIKKIAHVEDIKVDEILFINKIEAANKKLDVLSREKDVEARLQDLQEERKNKQKEINAAKEAAAEERKRQLEADHQAKMQQIMDKIREKEVKIGQQMIEKEKERANLANLKQQTREKKISAVNAAQQHSVQQLQLKIQQKQEASEKRKQENMDLIRHKAFELSVRKCADSDDHMTPRSVPYETVKMCSVCRVLIGSEIYLFSHLRGKTHQDAIRKQYKGREDSLTKEDVDLYNMKHIVDAPVDAIDSDFDPEYVKMDEFRLKSIKKHISRLRCRMTDKGDATEAKESKHVFPVESSVKNRTKLVKLLKEVSSVLPSSSPPNLTNNVVLNATQMQSFERALVSLESTFRSTPTDKVLFASLGGMHLISQLILQVVTSQSVAKGSGQTCSSQKFLPDKSLVRLLHLLGLTCHGVPVISRFVFLSNIITCLLDLLGQRLTVS